MKKVYLIIVSLFIGLMAYSQSIPKNLSEIMLPFYKTSRNIDVPFYLQPNNLVKAPTAYNETVIGTTYWDLQSRNAAPSNRFYVYPDGRMAAVWMMGNETENNYQDRGSGYAFFDGSSWSSMPTSRLETERAGWPSYSPAGDGEIIAAHHNSQGIIINRRDTLGEGDWEEYLIPNPNSTVHLSWPHLISTGDDNMMIHMLVNTYDMYEGLTPAILYYRSMDAGETWETQARIMEGMTSDDFYGLNTETYSWAEPKDSMIAFVVADRWNDLFIMRSNDNGDNWDKTTVWEHPYPMWNNEMTDTFYSPDGAASLAFDNEGKLHLAFGVSRTVFFPDTTGNTPGITGWFPYVDGIAYWNEDMDTWTSGDMEALNPVNLVETGQLIGNMLDLDDNGQIDLIGTNFQSLGLYYVGLSSMPQLTIDDMDRIFLVYSGVAEGFDDGSQMYRHLWARVSIDGGMTWGSHLDLTIDPTQSMNENVYPTLAARSDENLHLIYQVDQEPGLSTLGDMDAPTINSITYLEIPKSVLVKVNEAPLPGFRVSQNYPNPFSDFTSFVLEVDKTSKVSLRVFDITGRLVAQTAERSYPEGQYIIPLNAQKLTKGVYTYSFTVNEYTISNKMIVK